MDIWTGVLKNIVLSYFILYQIVLSSFIIEKQAKFAIIIWIMCIWGTSIGHGKCNWSDVTDNGLLSPEGAIAFRKQRLTDLAWSSKALCVELQLTHCFAVSPPFDCRQPSSVYFRSAVNTSYGVFQTLIPLWKMATSTARGIWMHNDSYASRKPAM